MESEDEDTIEFEIEIVQSSSCSSSLSNPECPSNLDDPQPELHSREEIVPEQEEPTPELPLAIQPGSNEPQGSRLSETNVNEEICELQTSGPEARVESADPIRTEGSETGNTPKESDNREAIDESSENQFDSSDPNIDLVEIKTEVARQCQELTSSDGDVGEIKEVKKEIPENQCESVKEITDEAKTELNVCTKDEPGEESEPPIPEPCRLQDVQLLSEEQGSILAQIDPVELIEPSRALEPTRLERVVAEIVHRDPGDDDHEDHIELEVADVDPNDTIEDPNSHQEPAVEEVITLIKVIEIGAEEETSPGAEEFAATPASSTLDDLEWEFDNEPPFESRHVQLKRNRDPRSEYELGEELGRGRFGTVFRCVESKSGRKLAAKFIHMRRKEDREDVEREVAIMCLLQHRRLLQLYDAFDDSIKNEMCLITELVDGGELFERIIDNDFELTEKKAAIFMRQICEGVEYMHSISIVHLDMKPENILCLSKSCNRIKVIDFGLARELKLNDQLRLMIGTPDFAAPEVLSYDLVSLATDMWSVGVICYVLLSGISPFMGDTDMQTMANVIRATYDFDDEAFEPISELAKDFISRLLVRDPAKRLRPEECLRHDWLARGGHQLEVSARNSRRQSMINEIIQQQRQSLACLGISQEEMARLEAAAAEAALALNPTPPVSLDKRNLKKYVVRRKWHKTVHAIMALGRMGAKLKLKMGSSPNSSLATSPEPQTGE